MIRITMLGVLIVLLGVFLGCSETPLQNTNELSGQNQQNVEFAALENDVVSLDLEDPQEPIEFTDEMIEHLGLIIEHMRSVQDRFGDFENRYPNEDAKVLLEEVTEFRISAIEAYDAGDFEGALHALRDAREIIHTALEVVRPEGMQGGPLHGKHKSEFTPAA